MVTAILQEPALAGRLSGAPAGPYPLHEASLLWRLSRRPDGTTDIRAPRVPFIHVDQLDAASRMARLLSGLTWAVVTEDGINGFAVQVPQPHLNRLARALTEAWRGCRILMRDNGSRQWPLAVALWRAAVLCAARQVNESTIAVWARDKAVREVLVSAARTLQLDVTVCGNKATGAYLVVSGRSQVLRLAEIIGNIG